jgi:hypothetical protein
MDSTFTPLLWSYQNFRSQYVDDIFIIDDLLEPSIAFQNVLNNIDENAPEVTDDVIRRILERA